MGAMVCGVVTCVPQGTDRERQYTNMGHRLCDDYTTCHAGSCGSLGASVEPKAGREKRGHKDVV